MTVKQLMNREMNLPSKEITNRFLSGQVKFNGVKLANPDFEIGEVTNVQELGDFLSFTCSPTALNLLPLLSPDPRLLFGTLDNEVVNVECIRHFAEWNCLQVSKKETWVFKNNQIIEL
jgi:hypothetical protein